MDRPAIQPVVSSCDDDDEARDLAAAVAGNHEAFGRLYDRHAAVVLSLCRRMNVSTAEADDALQETFIRGFNLLEQFEQPSGVQGGGFRRWLYAIARRVCAEHRRSANRRHHHEEIAMTQAAVMLNHVHRDHSGDDAIIQPDDLARLTCAIDQLDDEERLAIHLYYLDADPVRAAGPALNLSRSAYYKLLARARNKLAVLMKTIEASTDQVEDPPRRGIKAHLRLESCRIRAAGEQS